MLSCWFEKIFFFCEVEQSQKSSFQLKAFNFIWTEKRISSLIELRSLLDKQTPIVLFCLQFAKM